MITIIAGSRKILDYNLVDGIVTPIHLERNITKVFCGCAKGVDQLGALWASNHGIHVEYFPARWDLYGKAAGPMRNQKMVDAGAEQLIVIRYLDSVGSKDVLTRSQAARLSIHDFMVER